MIGPERHLVPRRSPEFLFGIGALGVMLRRSPLIVLLSLEIMLNGGNLALVGFSRHWGARDGQVFAIAVMAVAASEVVVGLGLIVAMARKRLATRRRRALGATRMIAAGGWICLLAPLAGALLITLAGTSISRRTAAYVSTLSVFVAFAGALTAFFSMWGEHGAERSELPPLSPGFRAARSTSASRSSSTRSRW